MLLFGTSLLTSVVIARMLGPNVLGVWVALSLIPSYAELFGRSKADVAAVYFLGRNAYQAGNVLCALNVIALVSSACIVIPIAFGYGWIGPMLFGANAEAMRATTYVMLLQIPALFIYLNYYYMHVHYEDVRSINVMVLTRALGSSGIILVVIGIFGPKLQAVIAGSTIGLFSATAIGIVRLRHLSWLRSRFQISIAKDLVRYGAKMYVGTVVSHLNQYSSQAIVVAFCAPAQIAFFTIAQQFVQLLGKVTEALGTFLMPRIAKAEEASQGAQLAALGFRTSAVVLLPLAVLAAILIRPALLLLYGPSYREVLAPFFVILPGLILGMIATTLVTFFTGSGRADIGMKIAVVPMILQVALGIVLVPTLGILGAALSLSAASAITAAIQLIVFVKVANLRFTVLVPTYADVCVVAQFIAKIFRTRLAAVYRSR